MFRGIIRELKSEPCLDCKKSYPWYVMDFDHLPGFKKSFNVSNIQNISSVVKLLDEIAKCELVCANCHRARTFLRGDDDRLGGDGNLPARDAGETRIVTGELDVGEDFG